MDEPRGAERGRWDVVNSVLVVSFAHAVLSFANLGWEFCLADVFFLLG